jgi:uncharacterized repeat protein (TIGR01451 family)
MLANKQSLFVTLGLIASLVWTNGLSGQTTAPARKANPVPPNVHIPSPPRQTSGQGGVEFRFSDEETNAPIKDFGVKPVSFMQDAETTQPPSAMGGSKQLLPPPQAVEIAKRNMLDNSDPNAISRSPQSGQKLPNGMQQPPKIQSQEIMSGGQADQGSSRHAAANRPAIRPQESDVLPGSGVMESTPPTSMAAGEQKIETQVQIPDAAKLISFEAGMGRSNPNRDSRMLNMESPAIEIESFGPQSVGIHKRAQYQVVIRNTSSRDADNLLVNVNIPQWVKIENVNTSIGRREIGTEQRAARVQWKIDRLVGGTSQTMVLDATPSRAENFDVQVEWSMQPRTASARVLVTEPRLEMTIGGPAEVLYGETAMYQVSVRNPGTGTAENVTVMLPEALGGERANIGEIPPGQERSFQVELLARAAGQLDLTTIAMGLGDLQTKANQSIVVRRPGLALSIAGPNLKYAGSVGQYEISITNNGDAIARDVSAALALPPGVHYIDGIDGAEMIDNAMRWHIGTLDVGVKRTYRVTCKLNTEGEVRLDLGARGSSDIAAVDRCVTVVETVADLILAVDDPQGPLPTGQKLDYTIRIKNRGSRAASDLHLVMQYSEGVEPTTANGLNHQVVPGQVVFTPISVIEPGQEVSVVVTAQALTAGVHRFRAQLTTEDGEVHEVKEGTTKFYGNDIGTPSARREGGNEFKR